MYAIRAFPLVQTPSLEFALEILITQPRVSLEFKISSPTYPLFLPPYLKYCPDLPPAISSDFLRTHVDCFYYPPCSSYNFNYYQASTAKISPVCKLISADDMTPPNHIPFVVTYRKAGTKPPVFVAGSFTEPSWQPQQMQAIEDASGEYHFSKELQVIPGRTYEIKFKIGHDDWWVYDEDKPVGT
jgi:hypothetical protein